MKRVLFKLLIVFSVLVSATTVNAQSWMWGRQGKSPGGINGCSRPFTSSSTSGAGKDAYITGVYADTLILGNDTLKGNYENAYLVKYNSAGTLKWAFSAQDSLDSYSYSKSVATDKIGSVYITGFFVGTVKFGTIALRTITNSQGGNGDVFLVKFDSNGNVLWAKEGSIPTRRCLGAAECLAVDNAGNPIISGFFTDTISFGSNQLINTFPGGEYFIIKYNSNGNVIWAEQSTHSVNTFQAEEGTITADNNGNILVSGYFIGSVKFGSITLTNNNNSAWTALLVKYSSTGNVLWAKQSITTTNNDMASGCAVITDKANNIYMTGNFDDTSTFGSIRLCSTNNYNSFLAKYDTMGNVLWVKKGSYGWSPNSLASDLHNRIYLGGYYLTSWPDTITFGSYSLIAASESINNASFIMTFDTSGTPICGSVLNYLGPCSVSSDSSGKYVYLSGTFIHCTIECGPDTLIDAGRGNSIFIGRWMDCNKTEGINIINNNKYSALIYPNPNNGILNLGIPTDDINSFAGFYNVLGEKVYSGKLTSKINHIDISNQPSGVYFYRIISEDGKPVSEGKFIIEK